MNKVKKLNETSVRVLETLKILHKKSASIQDIIHHFENKDSFNKIYTNEVILKYINTLKVFGLRFAKDRDKYVILNSPCQFEFDLNDLNTIYFIEKTAEELPEKKVKSEIDLFLQELEKHFSDNTKILAHNIVKPNFKIPVLNYNNYKKQINEYEKYCEDGLRVKITYKNHKQKENSIMAEPKDIKYLGNEVYFSFYNSTSAQIQDININSIIRLEQLPLKAAFSEMSSSVTFKLKDRLAKAYKFHEGEKLVNVESDGNIIVLNQKEDRILLLKRLMRYGENCEVISPKSLREEMKEMIKKTLNNYYEDAGLF